VTEPLPLPIADLIAMLLRAYGPQHWWPGETRLEIIVGAVLTQNTNWRNVARAIDNLQAAGLLDWPALLAADDDTLRECIRPSGFYNVKLARLRALLGYLAPWGLEHLRFAALPLDALRAELLDVHGIGPETADSILLYAFGRATLVVDAYTRRLLVRLGAAEAQRASYAALRARLMAALPPDVALYNEAHALIVRHAKEHCRAKPRCQGCPLQMHCAYAHGH
jgi:endonuclease-3 related protein